MGLPCGVQQQQEDQQRQMREQQTQQQQQQGEQEWQESVQRSQAQQQAAVAQGQQTLRIWQSRPPLPPNHNPLLGRWNSLGAAFPRNNLAAALGPELAALTSSMLGGITSGLCDSMLGRGAIEFRPTTLVALGRDGSARLVHRVAYRGGGSRVVVLPQDATSFTHMIIDFNSADHATVAGAGCVVVRSGSAAEKAAAPTAAGVNPNAATPAARVNLGAATPTASTLNYRSAYLCNREHIVVDHCRHDSDTPQFPPTKPENDYCQVYYPDRPKQGGFEAMGTVLRGDLIKTLGACGAFDATNTAAGGN